MTVPSPASPPDRDRRAELLAEAEVPRLLAVADRCLADRPDPEFLLEPETGTLVLTVREPVEASRFHLADVLVTRTHLLHRGAEGWALRLGSDRAAVVAAAVCDAEAEADGDCRPLVEELCHETERRLAEQADREWAELAPTVVRFEEMEA